MNQNKLSFESENLQVDWIGFNIKGFVEKEQIKRIAEYLFQNFRFNSTFAVGLDGEEEALFKDQKTTTKFLLDYTGTPICIGTVLK